MSTQKNNKQNLGNQRGLFFTLGLVFGLSFLLVAFEWRSFTEAIKEVVGPIVQLGPIEEVAVVELTTPPPPQNTPPPPPPPPSAPEIIEIANNDVEIETEMNIDVSNMNQSEGVEGGVIGGTGDVPLVDEVVEFLAVEEYPVYPGCEGIKDNQALLECFNLQVGKYLSKNVKYPTRAREMNKEGVVYVKFTIGKDGAVKDVGLAIPDRKIGYDLEDEAIRVVRSLPKMQPAKQRNVPTAVSYTLPIQFRLQ